MLKKNHLITMMILAALFLLAACSTGTDAESSPKGTGGSPAMVDGVVVETIDGHQYAVVNGFYPDPCTRISQVDQSIDGSTFTISLFTDSPDDLLCAQMLEAYEISILLETGGLAAGEYMVVVGDYDATFSIGP